MSFDDATKSKRSPRMFLSLKRSGRHPANFPGLDERVEDAQMEGSAVSDQRANEGQKSDDELQVSVRESAKGDPLLPKKGGKFSVFRKGGGQSRGDVPQEGEAKIMLEKEELQRGGEDREKQQVKIGDDARLRFRFPRKPVYSRSSDLDVEVPDPPLSEKEGSASPRKSPRNESPRSGALLVIEFFDGTHGKFIASGMTTFKSLFEKVCVKHGFDASSCEMVLDGCPVSPRVCCAE